MMEPSFTVRNLDQNPITSRSTEFVERKGLGHPDSICDGIAEAVSIRLSRHYLDEYGRILHHNTDTVQLVVGTTASSFGGGEIIDAMYVLIGGRATQSVDGRRISVDDIAINAAMEYVDAHFSELSGDMVEFESRIGETSADLKSLFDSRAVFPHDRPICHRRVHHSNKWKLLLIPIRSTMSAYR